VRLYVTRGGVDHISGAVAGTPIALDWLARRLTGAGHASPEPTQVVPAASRAAAA
jgi:hypothetical protein